MAIREEFVLKALAVGANKSQLCREYGVSRRVAYKWICRFKQFGVEGLRDLSRRPHRSLSAISGETVLRILELRGRHPRWGPKKYRELLTRAGAPEIPSVRTIARVLTRAGEPRIRKRLRRVHADAFERPTAPATAPNDLWTVDFKGWWRTRDRTRAEPLTIRDAYSRFILRAQLMISTGYVPVRGVFEEVFMQYGIPRAVLVDNGPPFGCLTARGRLTRLSAWWVSLGIRVVRGRPGHPEDNGGHERMHEEMIVLEENPAEGLEAQQSETDALVYEFNHIRPHEALGMATPAENYRRSTRRYRGPLRPRYPRHFLERIADRAGHIKIDGRPYFIGGGMAGYRIGLEPLTQQSFRLWFYDVDVGELRRTHP